MLVAKEYRGEWFLPSAPERKVKGILQYKPNESITLEILDSLHEKHPLVACLENNTIDVIYGVTHEAIKITLFNCFEGISFNDRCHFSIASYDCHLCFIGKHFDSKEDLCFSKVEFECDHLFNWLSYSSISSETVDEERVFKVKMGSRSAGTERFDIGDGFKIRITNTPTIDCRVQDVSLTEKSTIEISSAKKETFGALLGKAGLFKDFLSFALLSPINYAVLVFYDQTQSAKDNKITYYHIPIDFFERRVKLQKPFFTYRDIESEFPSIIRDWYRVHTELTPIRRLLINTVSNKRVFTSLDFLIVVQALEGYHRRFVASSDKVRLRRRLSELYEMFHDINRIQAQQIDLATVVDSRNYYSHFYYTNSSATIVDGFELYDITKKLKLLLICCVSRLVGFNNQDINTFFNKSGNELFFD